MRLLVVLALAALAASLVPARAGAARLDGDPASDTLVYKDIAFPYPLPPAQAQAAVNRQVRLVYARGFRLKVAIIATPTDLGAIPELFDKPADYAKFLGAELTYLYRGPLLIVMPTGYGISDGGRTTAAPAAVLARLPHPASASASDLAGAAATAVSRLLAAGALRSKDVLPPFADAMPSTFLGGVATFLYNLTDDSERAAITITVVRGGQTVLTLRKPMHATTIGRVERLIARIPATVSLTGARFCLTAVDPAGNRSERSCSTLKAAG